MSLRTSRCTKWDFEPYLVLDKHNLDIPNTYTIMQLVTYVDPTAIYSRVHPKNITDKDAQVYLSQLFTRHWVKTDGRQSIKNFSEPAPVIIFPGAVAAIATDTALSRKHTTR
jgi:hypothetical protein